MHVMTTERRPPREIDGKGKTVRELLAGRKYSIDYYQREYKWQTKQVAELIDDLSSKFLESYETGHERSDVANYGHYFLGSIIVSDKDGQKFIIDGQQRLKTLTLLLIFLQHQFDRASGAGGSRLCRRAVPSVGPGHVDLALGVPLVPSSVAIRNLPGSSCRTWVE